MYGEGVEVLIEQTPPTGQQHQAAEDQTGIPGEEARERIRIEEELPTRGQHREHVVADGEIQTNYLGGVSRCCRSVVLKLCRKFWTVTEYKIVLEQ